MNTTRGGHRAAEAVALSPNTRVSPVALPINLTAASIEGADRPDVWSWWMVTWPSTNPMSLIVGRSPGINLVPCGRLMKPLGRGERDRDDHVATQIVHYVAATSTSPQPPYTFGAQPPPTFRMR